MVNRLKANKQTGFRKIERGVAGMITEVKTAMICPRCKRKLGKDDSYFLINDKYYCYRCGFKESLKNFNSTFDSHVFIHCGVKKLQR